MKSVYSICFLFLLTLQAWSQAKDSTKVQLLLTEAAQLHREGQSQLALEKAQAARALAESDAREPQQEVAAAWAMIGRIYLETWQLDSAQLAFEQHLKVIQDQQEEASEALALAHRYLGVLRYYQKKYPEAVEAFQQAATLFQEVKGRINAEAGTALDYAARCYNEQGLYDEGIELQEKALKIRLELFGHMHLSVAESYNGLGVSYQYKEDITKAIEYFQKVKEIRESILGLKNTRVADAYNNLGACYSSLGKIEEATTYLEAAVEIKSEKVGAHHPSLVQPLINLGNLFSNLDNWELSKSYFERALIACKPQAGNAYSITLGNLYNNMAAACINLAESDLAEEYLDKAAEVFSKIAKEEHWLSANVYTNRGFLEKERGDYEASLQFYGKALAITLNTIGKKNGKVARLFNNIGAAYHALGKMKMAIKFFEQALQLQIEILGKNHLDVATTYNNLGASYLKLGQLDQSQLYLIACQEIRETYLNPQSPQIAQVYHNLGNSYIDDGQHELGIEVLTKAILIREDLYHGKHPDLALSQRTLGHAYKKMGAWAEAEKWYDSSLQAVNYSQNNWGGSLSLPETRRSLLALGQLYTKRYEEEGMATFYDRGVSAQLEVLAILDEELRTLSPDFQNTFVRDSKWACADLIRIQLANYAQSKDENMLKQAFGYAERSKAYLLHQAIRESKAIQFAGIPTDLLQQEETLRASITTLEKRRYQRIRSGLSIMDTTVLAINNDLLTTRRTYAQLQRKFEENYPAYYRLKYDFSPLSLPIIQEELLAPDEVLLEYFVSDSLLLLFLVAKDELLVKEIPFSGQLTEEVKELRHGITAYFEAPASERTDAFYANTLRQYIERAQSLYNQLIRPVESAIEGKRLIIIPDGMLGYLPFGALLSGQPKKASNFSTYPFLQRQTDISYCYSANMLHEMRARNHKHKPNGSLVAFAPFYEGSYARLDSIYQLDIVKVSPDRDSLLFRQVVDKKTFHPLEASGKEAKMASALWGGSYFIGGDATERQFNEVAADFRIIHLSTHGVSDDRIGDYSYLAFAETPDHKEDEILYARDLYNLKIKAELVVLSACETATGELRWGEGVISLARGFAFAGAKSILTTLWMADDYATRDLMKSFYIGLKQGQRKDEALKFAKIQLMKRGSRGHPFFWAGFIPIGDMKPLQ